MLHLGHQCGGAEGPFDVLELEPLEAMLQPGHELSEVNGVEVKDIPRVELERTLLSRPLQLRFGGQCGCRLRGAGRGGGAGG